MIEAATSTARRIGHGVAGRNLEQRCIRRGALYVR